VSAEREEDSDAPERPRASLRLIKTPEPKRPEPAPEMKAILDDIRRRYRAHRERVGRDPER
jgi:hypothetical protein